MAARTRQEPDCRVGDLLVVSVLRDEEVEPSVVALMLGWHSSLIAAASAYGIGARYQGRERGVQRHRVQLRPRPTHELHWCGAGE